MQPVRGQPLPRDVAGRDTNRMSRLPLRTTAWSQVQFLCQAPQAGLYKSHKVRRGPVAQLRQPLAGTCEKATCMSLACFESRFWPTRQQQVQCDDGRLAEAQRRCTEQTGWAAGALGESQGMEISSCSCAWPPCLHQPVPAAQLQSIAGALQVWHCSTNRVHN